MTRSTSAWDTTSTRIYTYRGRTGSISIPKELDGIITAVLGLDNRPFARPHFVRRKPHPTGQARPAAAAATFAGFSPVDVAELYDFPPGDGTGQTVGIIELGGGFRPGDLSTYFTGIGLEDPTHGARLSRWIKRPIARVRCKIPTRPTGK